jgi:HIV-1 Vpr-binding protein
MLLQFLQSVSEFTDHLSVLSENMALDVVIKYLNINDYNDIRLLFEALYCLGTMLIHLRLAWEFINMGGIPKLIAVNRHSVAAVSVCVCLHHLSQFVDIVEHVCQGPSKLLDDVVEYILWQLSHGYESSGARACGFFSSALQFKNIVDRFEQMDGLRVLYNYTKTRVNEYLDADFNNEFDRLQEKISEYGVILRNTCAVLQRYLMSHTLLKYESIKRHNPNLSDAKFNFSSSRMTQKDLGRKVS